MTNTRSEAIKAFFFRSLVTSLVLVSAVLAPSESGADITDIIVTEIIDSTGDGGGNEFQFAEAVAVDSRGNVFATGLFSANIFRISPSGSITVIIDSAGDGSTGFSFPGHLAVDTADNVYASDSGPANAFKISPSGTITQIISAAGDGAGNVLDLAGDVDVDTSGNVYVGGSRSNNVFKITPGGIITEIIDGTGDGIGNTLEYTDGIAVDSNGIVYVGGRDSDNAFKITPSGTITEIIDATGDGTTGLDSPQDVVTDMTGNVYVSGALSDNVFRISPAGTIFEIIDGTGDGMNGLTSPTSIAIDPSLNVYVTGRTSSNAFQITPGGTITEIIDSTGDGAGNTIAEPRGIALNSGGQIFVSGGPTNNAFKITLLDGICAEGEDIYGLDCFGIGCTTPAPLRSISIDATSDPRPNADGSTAVIGVCESSSDPQPDQSLTPGTILVADSDQSRIYSVLGFNFSSSVQGRQQLFDQGGELVSPHGIAVGPGGDVWVSDIGSEIGVVVDGKIIRIDTARNQTVEFPREGDASGVILRNPVSLAFDSCGNLFIVDQGREFVRDGALVRFDRATQAFSYEIGPTDPESLFSPWGLAIRKDGTVLVADTEGDQGLIYELQRPTCGQSDFVRSTLVGPSGSNPKNQHNGELNFLRGIAIEPGGNLLVLDTQGGGGIGGGQLFRIDLSDGTITEHASGVDGLINRPFGVLVEPLGEIIVVDRGNPINNSCDGLNERDGILIEVDPFPGTSQQRRYSPESPGCELLETQLCEPSGLAIVPMFGSGDIVVSQPGTAGEIVHLEQTGTDAMGDPTFATPDQILTACPDTDPCSDPNGINRLNPLAVALSPAGGVFIADPGFGQGGGHIVAVDPADGNRRRIVSGDQNLNFLINPTAVDFTSTGELLVLDAGAPGSEPVLMRIDPLTGAQTCLVDPESFASASSFLATGPNPDGGQIAEGLSGIAYLSSPSEGKIFQKDIRTGQTDELTCTGDMIVKPSGIKFEFDVQTGSGKLFVTDIDAMQPGLFELSLNPCIATRMIDADDDLVSPVWIAPECDNEIIVADPVAGLVRFRNNRTSPLPPGVSAPNSATKICNPVPIPEPSGWLLGVGSLAALVALKWRRSGGRQAAL